jgi:hypothetical protein
MVLTKFIICLSLVVFSLGTYLIWFDRRNVFNHLAIGLCFVAYIIPIFIIDLNDFAKPSTVELYTLINVVGVAFFLAGLIIGYKWKRIAIIDIVMKFSIPYEGVSDPQFGKHIISASKLIYTVCLFIMTLSFVYMGFVPMFATDPFSAKQFKGVYNIRYHDVALFYRTAKQLIQLLLPFLLINYFHNRKPQILMLIIAGITLVAISLSRSEAVTGVLIIFSIVVSLKKRKALFVWYIVFLVMIYSLGSSFWILANYYFPKSGFTQDLNNVSIAASIASGAPDIPDQLGFFDAFLRNHVDYTYGLTFVGGLVPFNFAWNPSVWTLAVLNETNDVSEIASGGLRLPVSIWGYINFGWIGAGLIPFFSAFFTGYMTRKIKQIINLLKPGSNDYLIFYYVVYLYLNIGVIFTDFYRLTIYFLPGFIFYWLVVRIIRRKNKFQPA